MITFTHYHLFNIISSAGPEMKMRMMEPLMGMLILSLHYHLFNNMITDAHLYSTSSVQYYLFCRAGDEEDEDDGTADRISFSKRMFSLLPDNNEHCSKVDMKTGLWYLCAICTKKVPCRKGMPFTVARWKDHEVSPSH